MVAKWVLLATAAMLVGAGMGAGGEPPKKKGDAEQATPRVKVFKSLKEMNAAEKQEMRSARYHLFRWKKKVQAEILCSKCKGKGRVTERITVNGGWGGASEEDVVGVCPGCLGAKICPSTGFHETLATYMARKRLFEKMCPFAAPLATGLETWLMSRVGSAGAIEKVNADAMGRLEAGKFKDGDVFLIGVDVWRVLERERGIRTAQAWLYPEVAGGEKLNLFLVFRDEKMEVKEGMRLLILGFNEGKTTYRNLFGDTLEARVLTVEARKQVGYRKPFLGGDDQGKSL